jgi:group II intron reverse transcriptase/maturase
MAHKLDYPKTEDEFRRLQDELYRLTKEAIAGDDLPRFKGLVEIASSETVILTAIHKIKANKGSQTPGSDGQTMRENILEKDYQEVISRVQEAFRDYRPEPVRRVFIPKPGKTEKRPLGIPAIIDRVIQECVRSVIEPILEAQFFKHSYGFRPMRDAHMALERTTDIVHNTGYHWIIEGDISKFFDNVNHTRLVKKLWHYGIRDRRMLMIIKAMLKAGIMGEIAENPLGTQQGGVISPLLANAYLNVLDQWIIREWEGKKTRYDYTYHDGKIKTIRKTKLKPAYLIRYADDWVLVTNSKNNAEKWKERMKRFLDTELKLTLSDEKTKITNIRSEPIHFVGFTFKAVKGKSRTGYISRTKPDPERLAAKVNAIRKSIKQLRKHKPGTKREREDLLDGINRVNSMIRGVVQYYEAATWVNIELSKYAASLAYTAYKALKPHGAKWCPADKANNLTSVHAEYKTQLPAISYGPYRIAITNLGLCKWKKAHQKTQDETPYTATGRELHQKRTQNKPLKARADELFTPAVSRMTAWHKTGSIYNFEYYLNRAYAFNRDKGKCRVCKSNVWKGNLQTHHVRPALPLDKVNRVNNLASVCEQCHTKIHNTTDYTSLGTKTWKKIQGFREKLNEIA